MMLVTSVQMRQAERDALAADVERFLANGGKIKKLAVNESKEFKPLRNRREVAQLEYRKRVAKEAEMAG